MSVLAEDVAGYLSEDIVQGKLLAFQTKLYQEQVNKTTSPPSPPLSRE